MRSEGEEKGGKETKHYERVTEKDRRSEERKGGKQDVCNKKGRERMKERGIKGGEEEEKMGGEGWSNRGRKDR